MKRCEQCKVSVDGRVSRCPLCGFELVGESDDQQLFPEIKTVKKSPFLIKLIALCTIIAAVAGVTVNIMIHGGGWWSIFGLAGMLCLWISFAIVIKKRHNVAKTIVWQVAVLSVMAVLWDVFTGYHRWSVDYVLPILYCSAIASMWIAARVMHLRIEDYIIYLIIDIVFGIIPMVLLLFRVTSVILPSIICVGMSFVSLAALLIFEGKALRAEMIRRTHM